jgi:phosphoglycolate phosphatase
MRYSSIIFDFDGTLADTLPWMRSVFNELAEEYGFRKLAPEDFLAHRDLHGTALFKAVELPLWKVPLVVAAMRRKMAQSKEPLKLYEGIPEGLAALKSSGAQLAVCSSNSEENVRKILGAISQLIDEFSCGVSMFGKGARLRQLMNARNWPPQSCLYVGDELRDAEAAKKAGMHFGAVTWGQHSKELLSQQNPAHIFDSPSQLRSVLS